VAAKSSLKASEKPFYGSENRFFEAEDAFDLLSVGLSYQRTWGGGDRPG
jgi:hypothetical protein